MNRSLRRALRLVALGIGNAVVLLALFAAVEWGLRRLGIPYTTTWTPTETAIARFDPELGWSYLPDLAVVQKYGDSIRPVFTDSRGVRVAAPGAALLPAAPSLVIVGGSIAFGHGLAWEESLAGGLERRLGLQVVDLGVQAYGTDQAWLALRRHLPRFRRVRAVVYVFIDDHIVRNGVADRRLLIPFARFAGTKPLFQLDRRGTPVLVRTPRRYSELRNSWLLDLIKIRIGGALGLFPPRPEALTAALVGNLAATSRAAGARFLVVHWRLPGDVVRPWLRDDGREALDVGLEAPPGWQDMTIPGDGHPDARAHDFVAGLVAARLAAPSPGHARAAGRP